MKVEQRLIDHSVASSGRLADNCRNLSKRTSGVSMMCLPRDVYDWRRELI